MAKGVCNSCVIPQPLRVYVLMPASTPYENFRMPILRGWFTLAFSGLAVLACIIKGRLFEANTCKISPMRTNVVDLFCGIGGLSYGFKKEGFRVSAGIDVDESASYAFETNINAEFVSKSISEVPISLVSRFLSVGRPTYRVLIGCAPCAPFSTYTERYRKAGKKNAKWGLLNEFARIAIAVRPDVVSMENVAGLERTPIFASFVRSLRNAGYCVSHYIVRADLYGVPQKRRRLVLFASLHGDVVLLPPTHASRPRTVRDVIGNLPRIRAGVACCKDRLHVSRAITDKNLLRLKATTEGGSWKDWPDELQLKCHKKRKGKSFRSVYGRMAWDSLGSVITTQCLGIGNGRFGHPSQARAISIREAAMLQTFPKKFAFVAPDQAVVGIHLARQIGNAVPVRLAQIIARSVRDHLRSVTFMRKQDDKRKVRQR